MWAQTTSAFVVFINGESFQLLLYLWTHFACGHLCCVHFIWLLRPGAGPVRGHSVRLLASGGRLRTCGHCPESLTMWTDSISSFPIPQASTQPVNLPKCLELFFQKGWKDSAPLLSSLVQSSFNQSPETSGGARSPEQSNHRTQWSYQLSVNFCVVLSESSQGTLLWASRVLG